MARYNIDEIINNANSQKKKKKRYDIDEILNNANNISKSSSITKTNISTPNIRLNNEDKNFWGNVGNMSNKMLQEAIKVEEQRNFAKELLKNSISNVKNINLGDGFVKASSAFDDGYQFGDVSKTILSTTGDVALNVGKGIMNIGEGIGDLATYGIAGIADLTGNDEYADKLRYNASNMNVVDDLTKPVSDFVDKNSVLGDKADEIAQGLGYTILTRTLQQLKAFMKYLYPDIEEDVLTMFSEIVQDTYKRYKIDFDTDFTKITSADYPTFDDVYATIKGKLLSMPDATRERDVIERLELKIRPLTKELRYYFTGHTNLRFNSDFIVFNIRELMNSDENIKNTLFFNILKYAWGLTLDKNINTVMMVDEAHVLLSSRNELGAEFLAQIQRRSRKYNTGTIIITQQPTDFAAPNMIVHGKAIFDNASYYLVMGLRKQAVDDLAKLIDLNESEKDSIKYYNQGEALFICGNRRMRITVIVTQEELDSFGSGGGL